MKYLIKTYSNWRRLTAIMLLLLFSTSSILWAYPLEICNMACQEIIELQKCCSEVVMVQSCCDMMDLGETDKPLSKRSESALSDNNCKLELSNVQNNVYLLPKNIQNNYELTELATIHFEELEQLTEHVKNNSDYYLDNESPIYIQISSYLI